MPFALWSKEANKKKCFGGGIFMSGTCVRRYSRLCSQSKIAPGVDYNPTDAWHGLRIKLWKIWVFYFPPKHSGFPMARNLWLELNQDISFKCFVPTIWSVIQTPQRSSLIWIRLFIVFSSFLCRVSDVVVRFHSLFAVKWFLLKSCLM